MRFIECERADSHANGQTHTSAYTYKMPHNLGAVFVLPAGCRCKVTPEKESSSACTFCYVLNDVYKSVSNKLLFEQNKSSGGCKMLHFVLLF